VVDSLLEVSLSRCYHAEGDACFGEAHGRAFGSVELGAGLDDLGGQGLSETVFGKVPVTVHRVEVEFGRVNDEMVVQIIRVRYRFELPTPFVEGDLSLPPVSQASPRLRLLCR